MRFSRTLPAVALVAVLAAGCDSSSSSRTPTLIDAGAFDFDRSFPEQPSAAQGGDYSHFSQGFARVALVTAAVGVHLAVPHAATAAATRAEPFVEDGTWIWANTVPVNGSNVTFRLEGTPDGARVDWRMRISAANLAGQTYDEFVLYEAETALDGRSGSWELFYRIDGQRTEVLEAEFSAASRTAGEITFSVPETNPNADARGSEVTYEADDDRRLFDWQEPTAGRTHLVAWDEQTHVGSVTAWNYNDGARACWSADLQNVDCSPAAQ